MQDHTDDTDPFGQAWAHLMDEDDPTLPHEPLPEEPLPEDLDPDAMDWDEPHSGGWEEGDWEDDLGEEPEEADLYDLFS